MMRAAFIAIPIIQGLRSTETGKKVEEEIQKFFLNKNISTETTFNLEACIRNNSEAVLLMDENLKLIIGTVTKLLRELSPKKQRWLDMINVIESEPSVEAAGEHVQRTSEFTHNSSYWSFGEKEPDMEIIKKVYEWFEDLINDEDVLAVTKIDIEALAKIVAATSLSIQNPVNYLAGKDEIEKTMIDIGIVRYPDIDNPYFRIYRIKLTAWQKTDKILGQNTNRNGIRGKYMTRKYKPRESILREVRPDIRSRAVRQVEQMLESLFE